MLRILFVLIFILGLPIKVAVADKALLIGIDTYQRDPRIGPLGGTVNDAQAMSQMLQNIAHYQTADIALLTNADATRANIKAKFESWLIAGTAPGERVFLHYSGHGSQVPDDNGDEKDRMDEVLIPVDAYVDDDNTVRNIIRDDEIGQLLDQLHDRKVTVLIDSCFSGTMTRAMGFNAESTARTPLSLARVSLAGSIDTTVVANHRQEPALLENRPNHTIWTAVSSYQYALEDIETKPRSGLFSNRFIRGVSTPVADLDQDGQTSHLELHRWLSQESEQYCTRLRCSLGLTPTLEIERALQQVSVKAVLNNQIPPSSSSDTLLPQPDNTLQARVEILPSSTARLGQTVKFRVSSNFDGYLLLLDINPQQQLTQLFPNLYSERQNKSKRIFSHRPITLPDHSYGFAFTAQAPLGQGRLIALVTSDPVDLSDVAPASRGLRPVPETEQNDYFLRIAEHLRQPWTGDTRNRPVRYALAEQTYHILP